MSDWNNFSDVIAESERVVGEAHALRQRLARRQGLPRPISTSEAFLRFSLLLKRRALRSGLSYIVGLSDYRYLSIFRFREGKGTSVMHFDQLNPTCEQADGVADAASSCSFVQHGVSASRRLIVPADGHARHDGVASLCGIPILTPDGVLIGTLCHYDEVPRDESHLDLELLLQVSSALAQSGQVPAHRGS